MSEHRMDIEIDAYGTLTLVPKCTDVNGPCRELGVCQVVAGIEPSPQEAYLGELATIASVPVEVFFIEGLLYWRTT